jgi:hypothetical protein
MDCRRIKVLNRSVLLFAFVFFSFLEKSPGETHQVVDYSAVRAALTDLGVPLAPSGSEEIIIISQGMEKCALPLCKFVRRLAQSVGPIEITLRKSESFYNFFPHAGKSEIRFHHKPGLGGWNAITLNTDLVDINGFLNGKNLVLRHELLHSVLSYRLKNHFLNGGFVQNIFSGYSDGFLFQEFLTYTTDNRKIDSGLRSSGLIADSYFSNTRRRSKDIGDANIKEFLKFLSWIKEINPLSIDTEFIDRKKFQGDTLKNEVQNVVLHSNSLVTAVVMESEENSWTKLLGAYEILLVGKNGQTMSFFSDLPFEKIRYQLPDLFNYVTKAAKTFLNSTLPEANLGELTVEDWVELKKVFTDEKSLLRFKQEPPSVRSCSAIFN